MKLNRKKGLFIVTVREENDGFHQEHEYIFPTIEEVENYLGMHNNYEKNVYKYGTDIYGEEHFKTEFEIVDSIYDQSEYEIEYDGDENEQ